MTIVFRACILASLVSLIVGCNQQGNPISNIPMLPHDESRGPGPWQVLTDRDVPVTYYEKRVFIGRGSLFMLSDGTPIRTLEGHQLYLNDQGLIINKNLEVIPYNHIFELNKREPLPVDSALKIKDYGAINVPN